MAGPARTAIEWSTGPGRDEELPDRANACPAGRECYVRRVQSKRRIPGHFAVAAALAASACGAATGIDVLLLPPDGGTHDAAGRDADLSPDATPDAGVDATPDAGQDAEVDATLDAGVDATSDAGVDASSDVGPLDANACIVTDADPSYAATDPMGACSEGQNTDFPPTTNCGGSSVAWEYVPAHDLDVTRLELVVSGGGVALYDSDGDQPGPMLFSGSFTSGTWQWRGVDVSPPIHLHACHSYYIEQITPPEGDTCSSATSGTAQRQFNPPGFGGSPGWDGPFIWLYWTAHVIGTCP